MQENRPVWRRVGPDVIKVEEFFPSPVFDPSTGQTHFLTELPTLLLEAVSAFPRRVDDVINDLAGPIELDESAAMVVSAALEQLEKAELIESFEHPADET